MHTIADISRAFEWIAIGVLVGAFALAVLAVARDLSRHAAPRDIYRRGREVFGRGLLLSLEILVAADLVHSVVTEPTRQDIEVLLLIVLVRILLSFAIDVEIDGVLPWRKREWRASREAE